MKAAIPIVITICALLALQPELRLAVPLLVGLTGTMTIVLTWILYRGENSPIKWSPATILVVALLMRLLFVTAPPQLSDDLYRYLWDGSTVLQGKNPYAAAPSAVTPPALLKEVHAHINHPQYVTIYPPAAQVIFAAGAALGGTTTGLKAFLLLLDMGMCALLMVLLRRLEMPVWRSVLYAWNPLPILEISGSGHVDGAGLALLMGSFCLLVVNQPKEGETTTRRLPYLLAGGLLAGACLVKLFPLVLAPVLLLLVPASRRTLFAGGFAGGITGLVLPFLPHLANITASLDTYARHWEFAGFAFNTLRVITGSGTVSRLLLSSCFLGVVIFVFLRCVRQSSSGASSAITARQALSAWYAITMALLLLTPTLQPWYALTMAALIPFSAGPAGLILCWVVFLTYRVQIPYFILGEWVENPWVTAAVFLAPVTAFILGRILVKPGPATDTF